MKKYPVVSRKDPIVAKRPAAEPRRGRTLEGRDDALEPAEPFGQLFFSFQYTFTEITAGDRTARVKSHRARYENGRLQSERFEGEVDRQGYERTLSKAQRHFAEQTANMLRSVFSFFPLPRSGRD